MVIFDKLVEIRKQKGITQADMSVTLKIGKTTLNRYETGKREISGTLVEKYAKVLDYELKLMVK
jgi:transcriptional regulator with XRE-family HTH domain